MPPPAEAPSSGGWQALGWADAKVAVLPSYGALGTGAREPGIVNAWEALMSSERVEGPADRSPAVWVRPFGGTSRASISGIPALLGIPSAYGLGIPSTRLGIPSVRRRIPSDVSLSKFPKHSGRAWLPLG